MAVFNNMAITNKGMALYTKIQAGKELKFTKMRVGSGKFEGDPIDLLDLVDGKLDVEIVKVSPNPQQKIALINGIVNNSSLTTALYICELGLYAEDPDEGEILYGYTSAGEYGDYYSPISNGPFSWSYQVAAAIGNASNIHVTMSESSYDYSLVNTNTNLTVINGATQYDINQQIDTYLKESRCETAKGTATEIKLTIDSFYPGLIKNFWASENSNNASITINGKPCYKPNTTISPNFVKGKPYTVIYNETAVTGGCFFIKASAEGKAKPNQVLALVDYSNEDDIGILGTMPNNTQKSIGGIDSSAFTSSKNLCYGSTYNNYVGSFDILIPEGYYDGNGNRIHIPNLLPKNILGGVKVGWEGNYIEGNITNHGSYTDSVNSSADNDYLYTGIPSGAYINNSSNGYPEIKSSLTSVANALRRLSELKKNEFIGNMNCPRCKVNGEYGDGENTVGNVTINLGFKPKMVFIYSEWQDSKTYYNGVIRYYISYTTKSGSTIGLSFSDDSSPGDSCIEITDNGFTFTDGNYIKYKIYYYAVG